MQSSANWTFPGAVSLYKISKAAAARPLTESLCLSLCTATSGAQLAFAKEAHEVQSQPWLWIRLWAFYLKASPLPCFLNRWKQDCIMCAIQSSSGCEGDDQPACLLHFSLIKLSTTNKSVLLMCHDMVLLGIHVMLPHWFDLCVPIIPHPAL